MIQIKSLLLLLLVSIPLAAQTTQITSAPSLFESLKSGEDVNAVIHYAKCKLLIDGEETQSPDAVGGMKLIPLRVLCQNEYKK